MATLINTTEERIKEVKDRVLYLEAYAEIIKLFVASTDKEIEEFRNWMRFVERALIIFGIVELIMMVMIIAIIKNY